MAKAMTPMKNAAPPGKKPNPFAKKKPATPPMKKGAY